MRRCRAAAGGSGGPEAARLGSVSGDGRASRDGTRSAAVGGDGCETSGGMEASAVAKTRGMSSRVAATSGRTEGSAAASASMLTPMVKRCTPLVSCTARSDSTFANGSPDRR